MTMTRLIIPFFAALLGASTVLASGAFSDRRAQSGDAFLMLLEAAHAAAVAEQGDGGSR
jgi:hypothetical protein